MPIMQIPRFPSAIRIDNLESFIEGRLINKVGWWPDQAVPLLGYMAWPIDPVARGNWQKLAETWEDQSGLESVPPASKIIQQHWARIADIFHKHYDLAQGQHQLRRGGSSVGKAITLVAEIAKAKGTGEARLWEIWKAYKNVAHLVTAAVLVSAEAQNRHRNAPYGLKLHELLPFRIVMLMPDLVISVAMEFERYALDCVAHGRSQPLFDSQELWRIPPDINVIPLAPPTRKIGGSDLAVLNARRAGNRGQAKLRRTTPVFDRSS